ncbi:lipase family protein [Runella sp.]|jgi:pimeloyl-ACP methyl ester carboxylesterase|uniref:alpha/beta hydrolase family protein n=1 Tax=Runella sp. TaxID=1960881 RepID=UPI00261B92E4|nr:lipase family protein [Runella sp.]
MKPIQQRFYALFLVIAVFVSGCNKSTDPTPAANQYLVSSALIGEFTKDQLSQRIIAGDPTLGQIAPFLQNGIKVYKLIYKTKTIDGKEIQASGALIYPVKTTASAMISIQHGTIRTDQEAPSYFGTNSEANIAGSLFASLGYIISYPDYIGYGASNSVPHPYEHRASLASASLDMIRASKEFVKEQKVSWDERLYIAGYSAGGFATMSLQKKIEEETGSEFNLKASSCGAGAYDKTAFMKYLISTKTGGAVSSNQLYLWTLLTYDRIYGLNRTLSTYFKEPYLTPIQSQKENASINVSFNTIFTDAFVKGIADGTDTGFLNAVKDNDVFDWKPKTPTRLYHGTADQLVFYFNSQNAVNAMKARGATNVELIPIPGKDHGTAIQDFLLGTYQFFSSIQ